MHSRKGKSHSTANKARLFQLYTATSNTTPAGCSLPHSKLSSMRTQHADARASPHPSILSSSLLSAAANIAPSAPPLKQFFLSRINHQQRCCPLCHSHNKTLCSTSWTHSISSRSFPVPVPNCRAELNDYLSTFDLAPQFGGTGFS